jgi:hypothetical protein
MRKKLNGNVAQYVFPELQEGLYEVCKNVCSYSTTTQSNTFSYVLMNSEYVISTLPSTLKSVSTMIPTI